ncbi:MAG: mandelate racemase/muconate lactonizing enzyme family protein [Bryobacteraceae bacterium]|nr:mandelate racemase/muconate lactonizing enzyme family protein [Bryobacteraceae bacterium]
MGNVGDGCLIRIETDSGLIGYGESGINSGMARERIATIQQALIGQDPLAIERHFYRMSGLQYSFVAHIPTISGIDIALWDLAGKILDRPLYQLLGGPMRAAAPVYSHGNIANMLDAGECRAWAQRIKQAPEGFTLFKFGLGIGDGRGGGAGRGQAGGRRGGGGAGREPFVETLDGSTFRKVGRAYANLREAAGEEIDLAMHCTGQFDTPSAIGLCRAIEPADPLFIEDPLAVHYSEAWLALKRATRVPLFAGEKVELVRGFRPFLDNQAVDMIHPDVAYSGGITGCKKIADYAALTRTPVGLHSGPCSLIRLYASVHLSAAIQNFFQIENALGEFRGFKEKMAAGGNNRWSATPRCSIRTAPAWDWRSTRTGSASTWPKARPGGDDRRPARFQLPRSRATFAVTIA